MRLTMLPVVVCCLVGPAVQASAQQKRAGTAHHAPRAVARGNTARRIRSVSRQQRSDLLRPRRAGRSRRRNGSAARTPSVSRCSRTITRIQLELFANLNIDRIVQGTTRAEIHAGLRTRSTSTFRRPCDRAAPTRSIFTTQATPRRGRPLRCPGIQEGPGRRPLDQHRE